LPSCSTEAQACAPAGAADRRAPLPENAAILVPAGTWHNITNVGPGELKLYSLYAPPEHARGAEQRA
jgi:mannose-6-phosphate isomerase-like protein (cupin superfamily)